MSWKIEQRRIPEAKFRQVVRDFSWMLVIDINDPGSSKKEEAASMPMNGFGSHLYYDYLVLSRRTGLHYALANGLRLDKDKSWVMQAEMLLFRPEDANKPSLHHREIRACCHAGYLSRQRCFYCDAPMGRDDPAPGTSCQAFVQVMRGPDPVPAMVGRADVVLQAARMQAGTPVQKAVREEVARLGLSTVPAIASAAYQLVLETGYLASLVRAELFSNARLSASRKLQFLEAQVEAVTAIAELKNLPDCQQQVPWLFRTPVRTVKQARSEADKVRKIAEGRRASKRGLLGGLLRLVG
jgi:hypothetical protein